MRNTKIIKPNFSVFSFSTIEQKFVGILTKTFRQGSQNCILVVHRNFLSESYFSKTVHSCTDLSEKFQLPNKSISTWLSDLNTFFPYDHFVGRFLQKTFFEHFWTFSKRFLAFVENDSTVLSKLLSTCPEKYFEENVFWKNYLFYPFRHWAQSVRHISKNFWLGGGKSFLNLPRYLLEEFVPKTISKLISDIHSKFFSFVGSF